MAMSQTERILRARMGAYSRNARADSPQAITADARQAFHSRFELQVDPDGVLDLAERRRRAEQARKAYFTGLALKSAQARRRRSAAPPGA